MIAEGTTPKPNILIPDNGKVKDIDKFLMMYTCKICNHRNAQMISKIAYYNGMVISTCKGCKNYHLIADNEGKLDMKEYGKRIEDYLAQNGEKIQRMSITPGDLENNYLVDKDGILSLHPKMAGQVPVEVTVVEYPTQLP